MTRQDFMVMARILATMPYTDQRRAATDHLCAEFKRFFPSFNEEKFRKAVQLEIQIENQKG